MKNRYSMIALLFVLCASGLQAQDAKNKVRLSDLLTPQDGQRSLFYELSVENVPYQELQLPYISLNNGEIWDDPNYLVPLPFDFEFIGMKLETLVTAGLGGALVGFYADQESPLVAYISPFDVDLMDRGALMNTESLSPIRLKEDVIGGNEVLIFEWSNAGFYDEYDELGTMNMFIDFQVRFFQGTNVIEYHFGPNSITNPGLIYFGNAGPYIGMANIDIEVGGASDLHLLQGAAANPTLTDEDITIIGTPPNGIVYRFTPMTSSTDPVTEGAGLAVWPNPAGHSLNLRLEGMIDQATILSLNGQPLWSARDLPGDVAIPVEHLPSGMYFLQVQRPQGNETIKWVKK